MLTFIGIVLGVACILLGFIIHGGQIGLLIVPSEYLIIFGGGFGIFLGSNGMAGLQACIKAIMNLLKPPAGKADYIDLLKMMYQLFSIARKEGLLGLEKHIENPEESEIIRRYPKFLANHHAVHFFADTMKVILTGAVGPHDLSEMMELDLDIAHDEERVSAESVQNVADAMPAVGIVAAVLGVILTMGKIDQGVAVVGKSVAAALVGTFLGIFVGYSILGPLARAMTLRSRLDGQYLNAIRYALFSFARGESPITCVEFARRNIDPSVRPGFAEMEKAVKEKDAA